MNHNTEPRREPRSPGSLDDIDKAIIRELQIDGRLSYAQLGPKVGLSQAAARQRVQRLIESGTMQVVAVTDPLKLGFEVEAMVGVTVEGDVREVAARLSTTPEIEYLVIAAGRFDLLAEVVCLNNEHLLEIVNDVIRLTPGVISTEVFTYLQLQKQSYSWGTR